MVTKDAVLDLLSKKHEKDVPNWTTKDQQEAMAIIKELGYLWFRSEKFNE